MPPENHFRAANLGTSSVHLESFLRFSTGDTRSLWILKSEFGLFPEIWELDHIKDTGVQKVTACSPKHSLLQTWVSG